MHLPNEKQVMEKVAKIKKNFTKSIDHMNDKLKKIDELEKTFMEHLKACDELKQGMPLPDDPQYKNKIVILDSNQRKKAEKFRKHLKIMTKCRERMSILLKQVTTEREKTNEKVVSTITNEQQNLKLTMMDIIKDEAYRLTKEEINNNSDKT